jgi:hypothetical protein
MRRSDRDAVFALLVILATAAAMCFVALKAVER